LFNSLDQGISRQPGRQTTGVEQPFGHQGLLYDPEISSYQNRHRQLMSKYRRFLQRDPLGYVNGVNMYGYCLMNPIKFMDTFGKDVGVKLMSLEEAFRKPIPIACWDSYSISKNIVAYYQGDTGKEGFYKGVIKEYAKDLVQVYTQPGESKKLGKTYYTFICGREPDFDVPCYQEKEYSYHGTDCKVVEKVYQKFLHEFLSALQGEGGYEDILKAINKPIANDLGSIFGIIPNVRIDTDLLWNPSKYDTPSGMGLNMSKIQSTTSGFSSTYRCSTMVKMTVTCLPKLHEIYGVDLSVSENYSFSK